MAIQEQWAELLEPGLRQIFFKTFSDLAAPSLIPVLFDQGASDKAQEHYLDVGGMSDFPVYEGAIEYDEEEQGFKTTLTPEEYAKGHWVERKLVDDDLYNIFQGRSTNLARAAVRTREKKAASVFNNAFSATFTGGDSIALCGAHPYSPANATTQSNSGVLALSYDNVVTTRRLMREFVDDRGEIVSMLPDMLLVPPELEEEANEIVNTMRGSNPQQPGTGSFTDNLVQRRSIDFIMWDYLTDANNWFLLDMSFAKQHLHFLDRVPIEFALDPAASFNLRARFRAYMRFSYGWSDFKFVYGHNVT